MSLFTDLPTEILLKVISFLNLHDLLTLLKVDHILQRVCCVVTDHDQKTFFKLDVPRFEFLHKETEDYAPITIVEITDVENLKSSLFESKFTNKRILLILNLPNCLPDDPETVSRKIQHFINTLVIPKVSYILNNISKFNISSDKLSPDNLIVQNVRELIVTEMGRSKSNQKLQVQGVGVLQALKSTKFDVSAIDFNSSIGDVQIDTRNSYYYEEDEAPRLTLKDCSLNMKSLKIDYNYPMIFTNLKFPNLISLDLNLYRNSRDSKIKKLVCKNLQLIKLNYRNKVYPILTNDIVIGDSFSKVMISRQNVYDKTQQYDLFTKDYDFKLFNITKEIEIFGIGIDVLLNKYATFENLQTFKISLRIDQLKTSRLLKSIKFKILKKVEFEVLVDRNQNLALNLDAPSLESLKIVILSIQQNYPRITVDLANLSFTNLKSLRLKNFYMDFNQIELPNLRTLVLSNISDLDSTANSLVLDTEMPKLEKLDIEYDLWFPLEGRVKIRDYPLKEFITKRCDVERV